MTPHVTDAPSDADRQAVLTGLLAFNRETLTDSGPPRPLAVLWRDAAGAALGGAIGHSWCGWVFIELLHLPAALRGQRIGTELMRLVEAEARARHCIGIHLDTFSFQARGFYEKLGFTVFGTLDGMPPGHARYWLAKRLTEETPHVPA